MEPKEVLLCSVAFFLGIVSVATALAAEATKIKVSQVQFISATQCTYHRSPAMPLGLTAALALMMAQMIINVASGCIFCWRRLSLPPSHGNRMIALICYFFSCLTFVFGFLVLLMGASLNNKHDERTMHFGKYRCYTVKPGVFAGGAVLSFASVILGIIVCRILNPEKINSDPIPWVNAPEERSTESGIAMGHPQLTPQLSQDPVFVHEDTYMRRQYT